MPNIMGVQVYTGEQLGGKGFIAFWPNNTTTNRLYRYTPKRLVRLAMVAERLGLCFQWAYNTLIILNRKKEECKYRE